METASLKRNNIYKLIGVVAAATIISACSGGSDTTAITTTTAAAASYSGPGSKWNFDLATDGTFSIERSAGVGAPVDMTVGGNYSRLSSGFMKLTVGSSTGTNAPAAGETAWAVEVPGYALLVKPIQSNSDQIITMVAAGSCPTGDLMANWVLVKQDEGMDASNAQSDYFGTFNYNAASGAASLPTKYSIAAPTVDLGAGVLPANGGCVDGIWSFSDATMYLTDNGGAMVHTFGSDPSSEVDDNFIFALKQKAIVNVSAMDGDYVGMLFDGAGSTGNKIVPINMSCLSGACTGYNVTNIETGAYDNTSGVTVSLTGTVDDPETGIITGTISAGGGEVKLTCMVDINASGTGKKIGSCVGQAPDDATKMFNVMFVSKN